MDTEDGHRYSDVRLAQVEQRQARTEATIERLSADLATLTAVVSETNKTILSLADKNEQSIQKLTEKLSSTTRPDLSLLIRTVGVIVTIFIPTIAFSAGIIMFVISSTKETLTLQDERLLQNITEVKEDLQNHSILESHPGTLREFINIREKMGRFELGAEEREGRLDKIEEVIDKLLETSTANQTRLEERTARWTNIENNVRDLILGKQSYN